MFKQFYCSLPGARFLILNALLWLSFNTIAAYSVFIKQEQYGFWVLWRYFLSAWGQWIWLTPIIFAVITMMPYRRKRLRPQVILNIILFVVAMTLNWLVAAIIGAMQEPEGLTLKTIEQAIRFLFNNPFYLDFIVYFSIVAAAYIRTFDQRVRNEEMRNKELGNQLLVSELDTLKSQLNPHFLFNTLNCIASLIRQDNKPNALTALSELSLMLRKVLENQNSQMISLAQELEFIESYLAIQQMRFVNRLETQVKVEEDCLLLDFPFMLLQPLVENAIHHGVQSGSDKTLVQLLIRKHEQYLEIRLLNKMPEQEQKKGFGIGLSNCRKRLQWLYDDNFRLELKPDVDGYFETFLSIPVGDDD